MDVCIADAINTMTETPKPKRKRRTKAEIDADREAALHAEANRVAALVVEAPGGAGGDGTGGDGAHPAFLDDPKMAAALEVWRRFEPELVARRVLEDVDRLMLATLCYWVSEFAAATDDIARNGYAIMGKATSGGARPWKNPSVDRRDTAFKAMTDLAAKFGLTPMDRIHLFKAMTDYPGEGAWGLVPTPVPPGAGKGDGDAGDEETPQQDWVGKILAETNTTVAN